MYSRRLLRQNWAKFSFGSILPPNAAYSELGPEKRYGAGFIKKFQPKTCFLGWTKLHSGTILPPIVSSSPFGQENSWGARWRSRHHFKGPRSSTNWAGYESTSKEVQGCTQRTHSRIMGSSKFVEAQWAWSTWATKNRHLDSSSRRIQSRLRIGKKYFRIILQESFLLEQFCPRTHHIAN